MKGIRKIYDKEAIKNAYLEGKSPTTIARELGTYNTTIRRFLLELGIKPRTPSEVQVTTNTNCFKLLDDEGSYYLGLMMTDGNLFVKDSGYRISLSLQEKDKYILDKFAVYCKTKVKRQFNKKYNKYEYLVQFKNKEVFQRLLEYGVVPNKSFILNPIVELNWSILRGIVDGDGYVKTCLRSADIEIYSASEAFLKYIGMFLEKDDIKYSIRLSKPRLYKLGIYTNSDVIKIYHKFYNETSIFLERKRLSMARCLSNQAFQPVKVGEPVSGIPSQAPNLLGEGVETRRQAPNSKE